MAGTVKKLQLAEGVTVAAPTDLGIGSSTSVITAYADDATYVSNEGTAVAGSVYLNSTTNKLRAYVSSAWRSAILEPDTAGNLTLGANVGANNLTLGGASSTVVVAGNLQVSGTTTTVNSTTMEVTDSNVLVNNGGNDASSEGAGITVERTTTNASIIFANAAASKWKVGLTGAEIEVADISSAQVITHKDIDGGTASNTSRITVPKDTTTNIDALTRKAGTLLYDTTTNQFKGDNGTALSAFATTAAATPSASGTVTSYIPVVKSSVLSTSSNYTVTETDGYEYIDVTTGAGGITITLPAASVSAGRPLTIKKVDSGVGRLTVTRAGSDTIDGLTSVTGKTQYDAIEIFSDGTNWFYKNHQQTLDTTFNMTPNGGTTGSNADAYITRSGSIVTARLNAATGTASGTATYVDTNAFIPTWARPTTQQVTTWTGVRDSAGAKAEPGSATINTSGTIRFRRDYINNTGFANGAGAGLNENITLTWSVI